MEKFYDENGDVFNLEQMLNDKLVDLVKCTRVEVIDEFGRSYVNFNKYNTVKVSIQDDGMTLKVFIKREKK